MASKGQYAQLAQYTYHKIDGPFVRRTNIPLNIVPVKDTDASNGADNQEESIGQFISQAEMTRVTDIRNSRRQSCRRECKTRSIGSCDTS